jgi:hypothetical protein
VPSADEMHLDPEVKEHKKRAAHSHQLTVIMKGPVLNWRDKCSMISVSELLPLQLRPRLDFA